MFSFLRFHPALAWLNAGIILFVTLFSLAVPMLFKLMVEGVLPDGNRRAFLLAAVLLLLVTVGRNLFGVLQDYIFLLHRQRIEVAALQAALQRPDWKTLNMETTWATMQNFIANFQFFWIEFAFYVAYAVFISSLVLIGFYWIEPAYFWLSLLFMLLHAINFSLFRPRVAQAADAFNQAKSGLIGEVGTHLKLLPEVKSMRREALLQQRMVQYGTAYVSAYRRKEMLALLQQLVQDNLVNAFYILFFAAALYLSATRSVSIGSAALALFLAGFLFEPIYRFSAIIKSLFEARAYSGWIPGWDSRTLATRQATGGGVATLVLRDARTSVMAARGQPGLNLQLQAGCLILVKGASGCGKSTLLDCIAGVDQLASGSIDAPPDVYYCEQNAAIFPGDLQQNISFYAVGPDQVRVDDLLRVTGLYAVPPGQSPAALSGGQKQRLALARSLYCGQSLLLYDEPTAALDPENEHAVFARLAMEAKTRLIIMVSHSPAALQYAGQVIDLGA
jgi:ABC-type bacteriocin/lantibiotic exporter with double-glycine peptidase domain